MISVTVVNYNGEKFILHSLQCLMKQKIQGLEIIVVDNASMDNSVSLIRREFPMVTLIENPVNSGFAGGNNLGLRAAKGEFIALLNSDAFPEAEWLAQLLEGMKTDPKIGICASKLIIDGTDLVDSAGDGCTTALKGFKRGEMKPQRRYDRMENIFGACGGAVLYRRAMIEEIGFFDGDFFLIHEDTDLNFRAQLAGWKCLYVPKAVVYHRVRSTIGHYSDIAIYYSNRNADLVWIKNTPGWLMLRYLHHKILSDLASLLFFGIRKKRFWLFLRAKVDVLRLLPIMLKKRRRVQRMKRVSNRDITCLLTSIWEKEYIKIRLWRLIKG